MADENTEWKRLTLPKFSRLSHVNFTIGGKINFANNQYIWGDGLTTFRAFFFDISH